MNENLGCSVHYLKFMHNISSFIEYEVCINQYLCIANINQDYIVLYVIIWPWEDVESITSVFQVVTGDLYSLTNAIVEGRVYIYQNILEKILTFYYMCSCTFCFTLKKFVGSN